MKSYFGTRPFLCRSIVCLAYFIGNFIRYSGRKLHHRFHLRNRKPQSQMLKNIEQCSEIRSRFAGFDPSNGRLWDSAHGSEITLAQTKSGALRYHSRDNSSDFFHLFQVICNVGIDSAYVFFIIIPCFYKV